MPTLTRYTSPVIQRILMEIEEGEQQFDNELRGSDRMDAVLPVQVSAGREAICTAFSKDVSESGICIIAPQPFHQHDETRLKICGLRYQTPHMLATCCWAKPFNDCYWVSGWELDKASIDLQKVEDEEVRLGIDHRRIDRRRLALPVVVYQKNVRRKVHGFSRNISSGGVCLITNGPLKKSEYCLLEFIQSAKNERSEVTAECLWSTQIGPTYWISGWQFPRLDRVHETELLHFKDRKDRK